MLVLSRKLGEKVRIGKEITITMVEFRGNRVKIGIEAPGHISVLRAELDETPETGSAVIHRRASW